MQRRFTLGSIVLGRAIAVAILFMAFAGCNRGPVGRLPVHPVEGNVTLDGKPLANALVALHPRESGEGRIVGRGQTDADGKFRISTYDSGDGAPEGEYAVTVEYYQPQKQGESVVPGPNVLSPKLSSSTTTDIAVKVAAGPNKLAPIEVRR